MPRKFTIRFPDRYLTSTIFIPYSHIHLFNWQRNGSLHANRTTLRGTLNKIKRLLHLHKRPRPTVSHLTFRITAEKIRENMVHIGMTKRWEEIRTLCQRPSLARAGTGDQRCRWISSYVLSNGKWLIRADWLTAWILWTSVLNRYVRLSRRKKKKPEKLINKQNFTLSNGVCNMLVNYIPLVLREHGMYGAKEITGKLEVTSVNRYYA